MIAITNKKVAGFIPQWASYRGFSLLFDNPGPSTTPMDGQMGESVVKIDCPVHTNRNLQLYMATFFKKAL